MVGRFINHEGRQRNMPAVRFGNIAMMPFEKIRHKEREEESFLVEVRSIGGYSGSPVFVFVPPFSIRYKPVQPGEPQPTNSALYGPWLLGVNWAYLNDRIRVHDKNGEDLREKYEGWNTPSNTGMAAVTPVWVLAELLNSKDLKMARDLADYAQQNDNVTLC